MQSEHTISAQITKKGKEKEKEKSPDFYCFYFREK